MLILRHIKQKIEKKINKKKITKHLARKNNKTLIDNWTKDRYR